MVKIALLGAAGQIGTPLSLLLKSSDLFTEIALYDIVHVPGIAVDLNHIDTKAKVYGYLPDNGGLKKTLAGADIVVVTAGIARKPGMTRDDLFKTNATIIRDIFTEVAHTCPKAICAVVTNPVNCTVPVAAETLKSLNCFDPTRLFGVTTLDVIRASTFVTHALGDQNTDPKKFKIPVVGGHSGATILPLLSQAKPLVELSREQSEAVINRVQFGGDEIVKSKAGAGSATTCMAYAGFRFIRAIHSAMQGTTTSDIIEESFVYLPGVSGGQSIAKELGVDYCAVPIKFGQGGAAKEALPIGKLSEREKELLSVAVGELGKNVKTGVDFVKGE